MGEKIERWAAVAAVVLALVVATFYLGEELGGVKADVAAVRADVAAVKADVKADVGRVEARIDSMETRLVALFADQLRDNRRDVADVRERVSALEAAGS